MFLYQSNRLESLFSGLCECISSPLDNPLAAEVIVVQNPGMSRWLSQQIAEFRGISANIRFPLPATFIWEVFSCTLGQLPDLSLFDKRVLLWRILTVLETHSNEAAMAELEQYLENDDGSKAYQLAGRIADLFDQYQVYRPEMLLTWQQNRDDRQWQARIWRALTRQDTLHRASLLERFIKADKAGRLETSVLPQRISLFGINALAPAYLEVIERISTLVEVHVFHLSPCRAYWGDILSEKRLAAMRSDLRKKNQNDTLVYYTSGNPLLASMGMVGKDFFNQLLECSPREIDIYAEPEDTSLLTWIQGDILSPREDQEQKPPAWPIQNDTSIRFHCCHSAVREIQVLHDRLLDAFGADPQLKPSDILVMAPDISRYAPAVASVFANAREGMRIPWSLADQRKSAGQPVSEGFMALLDLVTGRFTASEVVNLLENPAIMACLDVRDEDIIQLRQAVMAAGIRWGLDGRQRSESGGDDADIHTWSFGLDRLLLGYMTGPQDTAIEQVLPCPKMVGSMHQWLGSLAHFLSNLKELSTRLRGRYPAEEWVEILLGLLETFFIASGNQESDGVDDLRELIHDFSRYCELAEYRGRLDLGVIKAHFSHLLSQPASGHAFLSGKVTFCNMVPMRSVPFKHIWLLGMNDTDYPRRQQPLAFDLMAAKPRLGDRCRRNDDRYLFLEAMLSARKELSISWIGRNQQDNTPLPPSVVVSELRDYIDQVWPPCNAQLFSDFLTTEYPLQPFSRRCFDGREHTASYAAAWMPPAEVPAERPFISNPLQACEDKELDFGKLLYFWGHPVRFFLEQRLDMRLRINDTLLADTEPFGLDSLQRYLVSSQAGEAILAGHNLSVLYNTLLADGQLPRGETGHLQFQELCNLMNNLFGQLALETCTPVAPCQVNTNVADIHLIGQISSLYTRGRLTCRAAKLKGKDLIGVWLNHLVLCLKKPDGVELVSRHAASDTTICFPPVAEPGKLLQPFLHLYGEGRTRPLHFYPETSHAWAMEQKDKMDKANKQWLSGYNHRGECEDMAYEVALRGDDPLDEQFQELATRLFTPLLEHMEVESE